MKNHLFIASRPKLGIALVAILLGIPASFAPAGAAVANLPPPMLSGRESMTIGWDVGGFDRNFDRSRDPNGFDRHFDHRSSDRGYDTGGFDRHFDRIRPDQNFDTRGWDLPPNSRRR
ncbi:MAG TPA: hypothetical protein VMB84_16345 [Stellaceae bacterium]|nr:hypothetical protein [Stellaceae bacterium]